MVRALEIKKKRSPYLWEQIRVRLKRWFKKKKKERKKDGIIVAKYMSLGKVCTVGDE